MKPTGATKDDDTLDRINELLDTFKWSRDVDKSVAARLQIKSMINERERLREALQAALNSLSRTVRKSYPNYPEEQMQISETMTVAEARAVLDDAGVRG